VVHSGPRAAASASKQKSRDGLQRLPRTGQHCEAQALRVRSAWWLLSLVVPIAPSSAQAQPPPTPHIDSWEAVPGFTTKRRTKAIQIKVRDSCYGHRVSRVRTRRALIITVTYFDLVPDPTQPYAALCSLNAGIVRVKLSRPLGRRTVKDGAFTPPQNRYKKPRQRLASPRAVASLETSTAASVMSPALQRRR
jgi:hypothetical protein